MPDARIGIVLSSTSVNRQRIQRLGRIIRRSRDKDSACLYYIYIRQSADNRSYLPGMDEQNSFDLSFDPVTGDFTNELYEYVAGHLLFSARKAGKSPAWINELRRCILKGLPRPDYLLPDQIILKNISNASGRGERSYWTVMNRIGHFYDTKED